MQHWKTESELGYEAGMYSGSMNSVWSRYRMYISASLHGGGGGGLAMAAVFCLHTFYFTPSYSNLHWWHCLCEALESVWTQCVGLCSVVFTLSTIGCIFTVNTITLDKANMDGKDFKGGKFMGFSSHLLRLTANGRWDLFPLSWKSVASLLEICTSPSSALSSPYMCIHTCIPTCMHIKDYWIS